MEEEIRAERAQRVLDDPLINEAFDKLEQACVKLIKQAPVKGSEATKQQQQVIMILQAQEAFKRHFKTIIETGMLARDKNFGSR